MTLCEWIIGLAGFVVLILFALVWEFRRNKTSSTIPLSFRGREDLIVGLICSLAVAPLAGLYLVNYGDGLDGKTWGLLVILTQLPVILATILIADSKYKRKTRNRK